MAVATPTSRQFKIAPSFSNLSGASDASVVPSASLIAASSPGANHEGVGRAHLALFFASIIGCLLWTLWFLVLTMDPKGTINRSFRPSFTYYGPLHTDQ